MTDKELFNEYFHYYDGAIFWKKKPAPNISIGMRAGNLHSDKGYRQVKLKGVSYMEHRVIWIMHNGDIPEELIVDHEDRDPTNSVIENLRTVTYSTNTLNSDTIDKSSSRYIGVSWNQKNRRWQTSIWHKGVSIKLGYFDTEADAAKVYNIKARELGKENINIIEEVRPNPEGYDIKGHEGKVDFDQVMNMQRVREREAEDKRQENLSAVAAAAEQRVAEQRLAREEIYSKAQERAKEIAAEMRKGLKDNGK